MNTIDLRLHHVDIDPGHKHCYLRYLLYRRNKFNYQVPNLYLVSRILNICPSDAFRKILQKTHILIFTSNVPPHFISEC